MDVAVRERLWRYRIARLVSKVSAPPIIIFAAAAVVAECDPRRKCYGDLCKYGAICIFVPLAVLLILRAKGMVGDFDLTKRSERALPMLAATSSSLLSWILLRTSSPGTALASFAGAQTVCLGALMLISLYWKISVHASALATLTAVLWPQSTALAFAVGVSLAVVCWARVILGKHTLGQVFAGSLLSGTAITVWLAIRNVA